MHTELRGALTRSIASPVVAIMLSSVLMIGCTGPRSGVRHVPARGAMGPYSGSVLSGGFCFVSGKVSSPEAAGGSFADEVGSAIGAVEAELAESGLLMSDVVSVAAFLTDMSLFGEFNEIYGRRFVAPYPARTTVGVAALPGGRRVELTVIARRPDGG